MELMDEIFASSPGLLSILALNVMKCSCCCFMEHVRCGIIVLNAASLLLVITFRMTELNMFSRKSLLSLADYEIMTVLPPCLALYSLKEKMTEDISSGVLKWPERKMGS